MYRMRSIFVYKRLRGIVTDGHDGSNDEEEKEKLKKKDKEAIIIILAALDKDALPSVYHFLVPIVHHASTAKAAWNILKDAFEKTPEELQQVTEKQLMMQKQGKDVDLVRAYADKIREHKELESRWAVLRETRVEYFRGKDFASFVKNHVELKELLGTEHLSLEVEDIANLLLRRNLIVRCDRLVKTVRPGKKKLSTWPAHLELFPEQVFSETDAFFAWTFEKRRPLWQTILSFLVPVVTLACCLFPIFPHWCKLVVLYSCLGFLSIIFSLLFLRWAIFGILWVLLGKRIWFFPNILAEEATFSELFQFWPQPTKEDEEPPKWTARIAFAAITVLALWVSIRHAPDEAARARYQKRVSNIIDEVLEWSPRLALSGKMQEKSSVFNVVPDNDTAADANISETNREPGFSQEKEVIEDLESRDEQGDLEDSISRDAFTETNIEEEMADTK